MKSVAPNLADLKPNLEWASLPLFDRTGWTRVRFGDVVENCAETCDPQEAGLERFIAMEHLEPGSLHIRSWGNVADGTTFTRRCRPGQVLFGKRRAYQRKVAVAEFEAVVSGDIYVLKPKNESLLADLLPFLCLSARFFEHAVGTSAGSLSPRTNWSSLASFEFDLPPLDQQRRIAEILWAVESTIRVWTKTYQIALQSLKAMVETYVLNGTFEPSSTLQSKFIDCPSHWQITTLREVAEECRDRNGNLELGRESVLSVSNQHGFTRSDERISSGIDLKRYKIVRKGEFGYNPMRLNIGSIALLQQADPGMVSPDYVVFRCRPETLSTPYFDLFRTTNVWKRQIKNTGQGSIRIRYYFKDIANFEIPIPPLDEQYRIVQEINTHKTMLGQIARHLQYLRTISSSLVNDFATSCSK
jgi:type I restriction enzyme, S subunit